MQAHTWQQSSFCGEGNACLQASADGVDVRLRESAEPAVELVATPGRVAGFLAAVRRGDLPAHAR
ncbi:DUF397 domain-containing protein [Streptomyces xiamenensis]|uniref:DUF397 domain-containing protein n=1 Tax=Streptomyces xiamenensis TaxID=408015 RepID=UPI003416B764